MKLSNKILCSVVAAIGLITGGNSLYGDEFTTSVGQVVIEGEAQGELRVSPKALDITGNAEGCRLDPYTCPAGLVTNGIGNTHGVPDQSITLEQVAKDWVVNLQGAEQCIESAEKAAKRPMSQGQFDAFTSFSFNTGCSRFMKNHDGSATRIFTYIKQGNYERACKELPKWVYGGGEKLPGLMTRRGLEYARCMEVD
ncbi:lysozyme [Vibrio cyclitrophicus]